jgi:hypothetical protein
MRGLRNPLQQDSYSHKRERYVCHGSQLCHIRTRGKIGFREWDNSKSAPSFRRYCRSAVGSGMRGLAVVAFGDARREAEVLYAL